MDENTLSVNEKLFSFKGVIGRHDYLLNLVIISFKIVGTFRHCLY